MSERTMNKKIAAAVSLGLVVVAVLVAFVLVKTAPEAEKVRPPKRAELVDVQRLVRVDEAVVLQVTGTVTPATTVRLRARVSGEVIQMSPEFIDGGLLKKDEAILKIDPVDYELARAQAQSALEKARFDYKIELGRHDVAAREWELLKPEGEVSELELELALRAPHLKASRAALQAAEANLKKAELNLERTQISAPFNAVVLSRDVNAGSQAAQQDQLAELAGTDAYWITVSVPVDRIEWVMIPGSTARIYSGNQSVREGRVIKLLGNLEEKGRMARLLIEVNDPLALLAENAGRKPLLIGEYVRVDIEGRMLNQVFSIPRNAFREGSQVWLATADDKLELRSIEVLWRDADRILVKENLAVGERLIVSDITAPVPNMDVSAGKKGGPKNKTAKTPAN